VEPVPTKMGIAVKTNDLLTLGLAYSYIKYSKLAQ
jgi:hypothetical protein